MPTPAGLHGICANMLPRIVIGMINFNGLLLFSTIVIKSSGGTLRGNGCDSIHWVTDIYDLLHRQYRRFAEIKLNKVCVEVATFHTN